MSKEVGGAQDQNFWEAIDAGVDVRVGQRVFYQCKDHELEPKLRDIHPPIRKRVAFIRCLNANRTVDLDVIGVGLVTFVGQDSGRSPGTWDCIQSGDDTEPARVPLPGEPAPAPTPDETAPAEEPSAEVHPADKNADGTVSNRERKEWNREHPDQPIPKN
jgi:hypothetical protein